MAKRWYSVSVLSNFEKKIAEQIRISVAEVGLQDQIEEQARHAWSNLQTARENAALLRNQANISAEFLELARKERQLGKRSLIDVLSGETNLINAQSDAASAESDVVIAGLTLLSVMGQLGAEVVSVVDAKPSTAERN